MNHPSTKSCCSISRNRSLGETERVESILINPKTIDGMVYLEGGEFLMGTKDQEGYAADGEGPVRKVKLNPFYIDATTVTNAHFLQFVKETGYKTEAELFGWSYVFHLLVSQKVKKEVKQFHEQVPWWLPVEGAYWFHPEGPDSSIERRMDHPVVHISWNDAVRYCMWAGKRLPTEAEWEFAARGGLVQKKFPWGDELQPNGQFMCNTWQGNFPHQNTADDGYIGTAPARSFSPNGYGLYQVCGNIWEWCSDWFTAKHSGKSTLDNPKGPKAGQFKVIRGGSYLCHDSYCNRYRVAARTHNTPDSSTGHMGFRCAANA